MRRVVSFLHVRVVRRVLRPFPLTLVTTFIDVKYDRISRAQKETHNGND